MIKTKFGSIVSHKFNNQYICYSSSIQPILKERILSANDSDEFRLSNNSNFLDLNNGFIKKHFWRKGAPEKINKIAIETASELIQKLIGAEVNNSSISAIVDDLSKRNGDKYYGN